MAIISRLTGEDVSSRYEALGAALTDGVFTEYQARDNGTGRAVRVRVVSGGHANLRFVEALATQMARLASITHPAVERVLDILNVPDTVGVILEPHRGADLDRRIRKVGAFPVAYAVDIAFAIAEGLEAAHQGGVFHGNLSASHVFLSTEGIIKITDLGVAAAAGSLPPDARPAPLAALGPASEVADIRAFGIILFQLLTGNLSPSSADLALGPMALNEKVPVALSNLVRCLIEGSGTYTTMSAALRDLRGVRDSIRTGRPMPAIAPPAPLPPPERKRERPKLALPPRDPAPLSPRPRPFVPSPVASAQANRGAVALADPPSHPLPSRTDPPSHPLPARTQLLSRGGTGSKPESDGIRRKQLAPAQMPTTRKRPLRRKLTLRAILLRTAILLIVFVLLGFGLASGGLYYLDWLASTPEVTIPDLHGKTVDQARELLSGLDLKLDVDRAGTYNATVPPGAVLRQQPAVGIHTKSGRTVHVFLSKGSRTVKTPDLVGKSLDEAMHLIQASGMQYKNNGDISSATVPYGSVVKQWPPAGKEAPRGATAFVKVSAGPSETDLNNENPDQPVMRTVALSIPPDKPEHIARSRTPGPSHQVEIREVGPSGDEKPLWQGTAAGGQKLEQDVKLDAYYKVRVYLDGRPLHTKLDLPNPNDNPVDTPPPDAANSVSGDGLLDGGNPG